MHQVHITPPENLSTSEKLVIKTPEGNYEISRENKKPKEGITLGSILFVLALLLVFYYGLTSIPTPEERRQIVSQVFHKYK